jgi:hypothetical protein
MLDFIAFKLPGSLSFPSLFTMDIKNSNRLNTSKAVPKEEEDLMWEHGTVKGLFTPIINVHCLVLFHQVFRSTGK